MAQGSQLRKQKRTAVKGMKKAVKKQQRLPPGSPSPTNPLEVPHLRSLEADLEQLGTAVSHNAQLYGHALTIAEMRLRVLERVITDQLNGKALYTKEEDGLRTIDFEAYNTELACCLVMAEFAAWAVRIMEASAGPPLIYQPGYNDTLVFGDGPP